ncbi:hypothetical protein [Tabrizicola sp.]|nr:hypothetical protein [Tabrizicola sp.]MDM7930277.1 hypothetical protein [Tabrizicola sp.]
MPRPEPAPRSEFLDLFKAAAHVPFPGALLEAMIARLEAGK